MNSYIEFIESKTKRFEDHGIDVELEELNPKLFEYEADIVKWALKKGRAAIFADCGLGKTAMQLEWANILCKKTNGNVLILAPLAVAQQTKNEAMMFGIDVNIATDSKGILPGINITNYEKLEKFNADDFIGVVLDESSILKSFTGKTRNKLIHDFYNTPFKLCCTATPAPNDFVELGNHSEFLGVMTRVEMLANFFVHDGSRTSDWNLKKHAQSEYWDWVASWAVVMSNPNDLGYDIEGFDLPELRVHEVIVDNNFPIYQSMSLQDRRKARKETIDLRTDKAAEIARSKMENGDQCLIWCDLNQESEYVYKKIGSDVHEIKGATKEEDRLRYIENFSENKTACLVTKPSIAGFGMNWQNCNSMIFVGLSDSYEKYYQAVRRCWRFGQKKPVDVYIVISAWEGAVLENINRKNRDSKEMKDNMTRLTKEAVLGNLGRNAKKKENYHPKIKMLLPKWREFEYECA